MRIILKQWCIEYKQIVEMSVKVLVSIYQTAAFIMLA